MKNIFTKNLTLTCLTLLMLTSQLSNAYVLVSGSDNGVIKIWNTENWDAITTLPRPIGEDIGDVTSVAFSSDGKHLVSGSHNRKIKV